MSRVLFNFMKMRAGNLLLFALMIAATLFGVPLFANPPFTKAVFDAAILDYQTKSIEFLRTGVDVDNQCQIAEDLLKSMLRQLAFLVDMKSLGIAENIMLSGFTVYTPTGKSGPTIYNVKQGVSGQALAAWPPDVNNHGYMFRYFINEEEVREQYTSVNAGNAGCTVDGLTKFKEYGFEFCVVYSDHNGEFSNPIFLTVI